MSDEERRALVVEDERSWQSILSEILTDAKLNVDTASNLEEAIALLRAVPHRLAVVDLSLGGADHRNQDGLAVLDAVRRLDPGCVTILLTGFATVELAVSALTQHGAFTCLRKETFHRRHFREVIERALACAPLAEATPAESVRAQPIPAECANGQPAALLVEDDAGWQRLLSELLAEAGYGVRVASSYGQARGRLRRERYALAVVDLSLSPAGAGPNMDGARLLAGLRAVRIPAIVVSGVAGPEEIDRAYAEHGAFACLEKQAFDRRTFLSLVREAVAACAEGDGLAHLTAREREVLSLLAEGRTNREIAAALVVTENTVKRHLKAIFEKLGVHTRAAAAARAVEAGMPGSRQ
ncbi:MAG: response regulator [Anaerolineae bacterium]|nr:response regulator [Anaerolineae bacterium]